MGHGGTAGGGEGDAARPKNKTENNFKLSLVETQGNCCEGVD